MGIHREDRNRTCVVSLKGASASEPLGYFPLLGLASRKGNENTASLYALAVRARPIARAGIEPATFGL